jgi:chromosome segregation ATPase
VYNGFISGGGGFVENNELLLKILEKLDGLEAGQKSLEAGQESIKTDVAGLKTDVAGLKTDVAGLKTDVSDLKSDVGALKADVAVLKTDVAEIKEDARITRGAVNTLLEWAEEAQVQVRIPLFKKADGE